VIKKHSERDQCHHLLRITPDGGQVRSALSLSPLLSRPPSSGRVRNKMMLAKSANHPAADGPR
jgi:hypothetical protein